MDRKHRTHRIALIAAAAALAACPAHAASFDWSSGTFVGGVTAPHPLAAGDVLNILAGGNKLFNASAFTNNGTVAWQADTLFVQSGAAIVNNGLWNASSDATLVYNGGGSPSFTNTGVFRKSAGTGNTTVGSGVGFVNTGTVDAQSGRIVFQGGSRFDAGSFFSGAGTVAMSSGTNTFAGAFTSSNLLLESGSFAGSAAVAQGSTRWSGGTLTGGWTVAAGATLRGVGGGNKVLVGATLANQGTLSWETGDTLFIQSGSVLSNSGTIEIGQNVTFAYNGGAAVGVQNAAGGTLRAKEGAALVVGSATNLANSGTLEAQAGATIRYQGQAAFNNGTVFSGAGRNVAAGDNAFNGGYTSANLELQGGTHTGGGAVAHGTTVWSGGLLAGTWTQAAGHTWQGVGGGNKVLVGSLVNQGTLAWNTTDNLFLQSGGTLTNQALVVANESAAFVYNGGQATRLDNTATGTLQAATGRTLTLGNGLGLVNAGTLDAQAGAAIVMQGGAALNSGSRFTGAGTVFADNTNSFAGSLQSANLVLRSGTHQGSGAVIGGTVGWSGGVVSGTWTVGAGQQLQAVAGGNKVLAGNLANQGTLAWNSGDNFFLQSGGTLTNESLVVANESASFVYNGGAGTRLDNAAGGTLRAAAGRTLTLGNGLGLVNAGTLDAQAGAAIVVQGGAVFNAGTRFTGAGTVYADNTNTFNGSYDSANLQLRGGNHVGNDALAHGRTAWSGGSLSGTWAVAAAHTLAAVGGGNKLISTGTLVNHGRLEWTTGDALFLQSGGTLRNEGTVDVTGDASWVYNGGAAVSLVNTGFIVKSAGTAFTIGNGTGFVNQGVVDAASGTITLPGNFTNDGTLKGTGAFTVGGTLTNAGHVAPGASPGTLTLNTNYLQTAAGSFDVELASATSHDLLLVNGNATLGGTLALQCFGACGLAAGEQLVILDATGTLTGTFAGITMAGFGSGAFNVVYDTAGSRVLLEVTQNVSAVPEPATWLMALAGAAFLARRRLVR